MDDVTKGKYLHAARIHLNAVVAFLQHSREEMNFSLLRHKDTYGTLSDIERVSVMSVMRTLEKRLVEVGHLVDSPYFVRCDVIWDGESDVRTLYFGTFSFGDEDIYSWIAPSSAMRFESPGAVSYMRPDGRVQKAQLIRKDQYMISGGQMTFFAMESSDHDRQLLYQEHFSNRKDGFVLPEIVSQMEKAQDHVIRADHKGPFLISGPAGSGKTTLALHRLAYLNGLPDLSALYTTRSMIVFVQDHGARAYFSHLLPELGVEGVRITTFADWAIETMSLLQAPVDRFGDTEYQSDEYAYAKIQALRSGVLQFDFTRNVYSVLSKIYAPYFTPLLTCLFGRQKKSRVLDRVDVTILLTLYMEKNQKLGRIEEVWDERKNGTFYKRKEFVSYQYSLALMDEFQNYLPEQLYLVRSCLSQKTMAMLYVGDMAQRAYLGTICSWDEIGESLSRDRQVVMHKVYRNTQNILSYIKSLGYDVTIPDEIREGIPVQEYILQDCNAEIAHIIAYLADQEFNSVGVLAKSGEYIEAFASAFDAEDRIHVMTMLQSQGLEFDIVFLVGIDTHIASHATDTSCDFDKDRAVIDRDVLYIALTRAISDLSVLGQVKLSGINVLSSI